MSGHRADGPRAGHKPSAKTARWDRRAARCPQDPQEKRASIFFIASSLSGLEVRPRSQTSLGTFSSKSPENPRLLRTWAPRHPPQPRSGPDRPNVIGSDEQMFGAQSNKSHTWGKVTKKCEIRRLGLLRQ